MELTEVQAKIRDYVAREMLAGDDATLDLDTPLLALGVIDSLNVLNLTTYIETEFGLLLDVQHLIPANLESIRTISRMVHDGAATPGEAQQES